MNILLWVLQILLALNTIMGAVWRFSNSEQTAALKAIPHGIWLTMSVIELFCSLGLILPAFNKQIAFLVPISAAIIAIEMLLFCGVQIFTGNLNYGQIVYWIVVAFICAFIAYGRFVLKPL